MEQVSLSLGRLAEWPDILTSRFSGNTSTRRVNQVARVGLYTAQRVLHGICFIRCVYDPSYHNCILWTNCYRRLMHLLESSVGTVVTLPGRCLWVGVDDRSTA